MGEKPMNTHELLTEAQNVCNEVEQAYFEGSYKEAEKRLFQPFIQSDYKKEKLEVVEGENKFSFSKVEINDQDLEFLADYIKRKELERGVKGPFSDFSSWYAIDQLNYSFGENNFDIFKLLPQGYKILFCPNSEARHGAVSYEGQIIFIEGDLASIGVLATILHEIGHIKDEKKLKQLGKTDFVEGGDYQQNTEAEKLRQEREASYFALRKMWIILRKNPQLKADTILYLKNIAYYSYCDSSITNLKNAASADHFAGDFDGDFDYEAQTKMDAWIEFRNSEEYGNWKKNDVFALLDESDEFTAWCEWIVETGKVDNKEFRNKYFGY